MLQPVIEVKNLSKWYPYHDNDNYSFLRDVISNKLGKQPSPLRGKKKNGFWALKDVSFKVYPGESLGIIGANGAGKSTLLKILSRITPPTSGEFTIRGKLNSLLEIGTGFNPELTGRENVFLNGSFLGMSMDEIKKKFPQIVEFAEIEEFLDTPVKHYSSGMYMRLAFSVAAHLEQDILLLDEVLAVGDAHFQKKSLNKIQEMTQSGGRTIIFVSHNLVAIQNMCERCIFFEKGKLALAGKPAGVVEHYLGSSVPASPDSKSISVAHIKNRRGGGTVRFTQVRFKNKKGRDIGHFSSGEDIQIWIEFEVYDPKLKHVNFSLGINNSIDVQIAQLGTMITKTPINVKKKMIKMKIQNLPLNVGQYSLTIIMTDIDNVEVLDWIQRAVPFNVVQGDFYGTGITPPEIEGNLLLEYSFV